MCSSFRVSPIDAVLLACLKTNESPVLDQHDLGKTLLDHPESPVQKSRDGCVRERLHLLRRAVLLSSPQNEN